MTNPADDLYRSQVYLDWVKTLTSAISPYPADDAHHIKKPGLCGGMKGSDLYTFPLTRMEHDQFHAIGWAAWEQTYGDQWEHVARTLAKAIEAMKRGELNLWADDPGLIKTRKK